MENIINSLKQHPTYGALAYELNSFIQYGLKWHLLCTGILSLFLSRFLYIFDLIGTVFLAWNSVTTSATEILENGQHTISNCLQRTATSMGIGLVLMNSLGWTQIPRGFSYEHKNTMPSFAILFSQNCLVFVLIRAIWNLIVLLTLSGSLLRRALEVEVEEGKQYEYVDAVLSRACELIGCSIMSIPRRFVEKKDFDWIMFQFSDAMCRELDCIVLIGCCFAASTSAFFSIVGIMTFNPDAVALFYTLSGFVLLWIFFQTDFNGIIGIRCTLPSRIIVRILTNIFACFVLLGFWYVFKSSSAENELPRKVDESYEDKKNSVNFLDFLTISFISFGIARIIFNLCKLFSLISPKLKKYAAPVIMSSQKMKNLIWLIKELIFNTVNYFHRLIFIKKMGLK